MGANVIREFIDGGKKDDTRICDLKKYLEAEGEGIKKKTLQSCTFLLDPKEIPKKSRFSSRKRLRQSRYSEGVKHIKVNRTSNKKNAAAGL
jgi:hypothetical protein